jgi:hypothetical protein
MMDEFTIVNAARQSVTDFASSSVDILSSLGVSEMEGDVLCQHNQ